MTSPFFRLVWRFNALAIAVASVIAVFIGLYAAYHVARDVFRVPYQAADAVRLEPQPTATDKPGEPQATALRTDLDVGHFQYIGGTRHYYASVVGAQSYDYRTSSKEATSTRNMIFFDADTMESRKLLASDDTLIIETRELREEGQPSDAMPKAMLYSLVEADTNKDGMLNANDARTLALSRVDGSGLERLTGIAGQFRGEIVNAGGAGLTLIVEDTHKLHAHAVDLATFKVTRTKELVR